MQTSILLSLYAFTYWLISISRVKVKPFVHFLEKKLIWYPWIMLLLLRCSEILFLTSCTRVKTMCNRQDRHIQLPTAPFSWELHPVPETKQKPSSRNWQDGT